MDSSHFLSPLLLVVLLRKRRRSRQIDSALRCYWETILRNPNHQKVNYRLSQLLLAANDDRQAKPFLERSEQLEELAEVLHRILFNEKTAELMIRAAQLTESLGRLAEAWGWYYVAAHYHPTEIEAPRHRDRLAKTG